MLLRFGVAVPLLAACLWFMKPTALFSLMTQKPKVWLLVMVVYPLASVLPQEFVYRVFFFERYRNLFGGDNRLVFASAAAFSFGHIIFRNPPAVLLTLIGGLLFGSSYHRTRSFPFVAVEHVLYGWTIFTIGFGDFFLEGTLKLIR